MIRLKPCVVEFPFCPDNYVVKVFDNERLIAQFYIESEYVKSDYYNIDSLIEDIGNMVFEMSHGIIEGVKIDELSEAEE